MKKSWILGSLLLLACLGNARVGSAQLAVVEVGANLTQNTITAVQSVLHTASWALELLGLPGFVVQSGAFAEDMATLQVIIADGQALAWDVGSLQAQIDGLFNLESAPMTSHDFAERMAEVRQVVFLSYSYAMRTQTLIMTTLNTINDVLTLAGDIAAVVGGVQGTQTIAQHQAKLVQLQSEMKVETTAFQRAKSMQALAEPLIEQSIKNINHGVLDDWAEGDTGQ